MFGLSNKKTLNDQADQISKLATQIEALEEELATLRSENDSLREEKKTLSNERQLYEQLFANFSSFGESFIQLQHSLSHTANAMKEEKQNAIKGSAISSQAISGVEVMSSKSPCPLQPGSAGPRRRERL
jgi:uncharacterized coiled-coil DUF342 family protein